jgi:hypothetical protein
MMCTETEPLSILLAMMAYGSRRRGIRQWQKMVHFFPLLPFAPESESTTSQDKGGSPYIGGFRKKSQTDA